MQFCAPVVTIGAFLCALFGKIQKEYAKRKEKLTREQSTTIALQMEKEIIEINSRQYISMSKEERKDIILTVVHKTDELRLFCYENDLDWQEICVLAKYK